MYLNINLISAPVDKASVQSLLEKHRSFFSRLIEIQSILECKNKIMRDIKEEAGPANVDASSLEAKLSSIYQRFIVSRFLLLFFVLNYNQV